jgi:DNA polymerase III gamma/tau subunit
MLTVLDGLIDEGHDLIHFWSEWIAALRDLLLLDALPERDDLLARSAEEARTLQDAAKGLTREDLTRAFQIVADLELGLKGSAQPQFLFEAALIRLAELGAVRPIEEILQGLPTGPAPVRPSQPATTAPRQKKKQTEPQAAPRTEVVTAGTPDAQQLIEAVRAARPMVAAFLDLASTVTWSENRLTVAYAPSEAAVRKQLEQKDSLSLLRTSAAQLTGKTIEVKIESTGSDARTAAVPAPKTDSRAAPGPKRKKTRERSTPQKRRAVSREQGLLLDEAKQSPGVAKLLDSFGAQVVEITPLGLPADTPGDPES